MVFQDNYKTISAIVDIILIMFYNGRKIIDKGGAKYEEKDIADNVAF